MLAAVFGLHGTGEEGVRAAVRATARSSVVLFLLVFTASSLRRLRPVPATAWLLRNRRYVGVWFAVSHALHLGTIVVLARWWPHPFFDREGNLLTLVGGGLAFVFIAILAATSSDRAVRALGGRRWRRLHTVGIYYVWVIFTQAYLVRALRAPGAALLAGALLLGLAVRLAGKRRATHATPAPA